MIKIVHVITGLGSGGAENMLLKLLRHSDKNSYYHEVISLTDNGILGEQIKREGVKVNTLNINSKNIFQSLLTSRKICKDFDIVNTWLYHADIFGFLLAKVLLKKKLIWNIRHSNLEAGANKKSTLRIVKLNSLISKFVDAITYNSKSAFKSHTRIGFGNRNYYLVPNGFELEVFKESKNSRIQVRKELGLDQETKVIITVGRWNIQKDYYTLIKALHNLKQIKSDYKMIMVGKDLDASNNELKNLINEYDLNKNIILLGRRLDIPNLLSASDIYISSSLGESFSNSIGEAMSCGLPCIVTDVGDSKEIVGTNGLVVEKQNPLKMSQALNNLLGRDIDRKQARMHIKERYDITKVTKIFEEIYQSL